MKQINTEENLGNPDRKRPDSAGGGKVPQLGVFIPSFTPMHFAGHQEAGNGAISFNEMLARQGQKLYENQMELYDNEEMSEAIEEVETQFKEQDQNFWQNNQNGKGYTDFVNQKYGELADIAISNHSFRVKDRLQEHFNAKRTSLTQNAFLREQEVYSGYILNKANNRINDLTKKVIDNPELAEVTWNDIAIELGSVQKVLPQQTFNNYFGKVRSDYAKTVAHAQITRDPDSGLAMLQKGKLFKEFLDAKDYEHMLLYAQHTKESRQREERAQYNFILRNKIYKEKNDLINGKIAAANGDERLLIKIANNPQYSQEIREAALRDLTKAKKTNTKRERDFEILDTYAFQNEDIGINKITEATKNEWFHTQIRKQDDERNQTEGKHLSLLEIVSQKETLPLYFRNSKDTTLTCSISMALKSDDIEKIKDAALTVERFAGSATLSLKDKENNPGIETLSHCIVHLWDTRNSDIENFTLIKNFRANIEEYADKENRKVIDAEFAQKSSNYAYELNNEVLAPMGATKEIGFLGRLFNKEIEWNNSLDKHEQTVIRNLANKTFKNTYIATRDHESAKEVTSNVIRDKLSYNNEIIRGRTVQVPKFIAFDNKNPFCRDDDDARKIMNNFKQGVIIKTYQATIDNQPNGRKLKADEIYTTLWDSEKRSYAFYHYNNKGERVYLLHNNRPIIFDYSNLALSRLRKIKQSTTNNGEK